MVDYSFIGSRIRYFRHKSKYTQFQLAELLEVTDKYISLIERGKEKVSLSRLFEISSIFSIDVSLLLYNPQKYSESEIALLYDFLNKVNKWDEKDKEKLILIIDIIDEIINKKH